MNVCMEFNLFIVHLFRNYTKQTITLILFDREALASASLNTRCSGFRIMFPSSREDKSFSSSHSNNIDKRILIYSTRLVHEYKCHESEREYTFVKI